MINLRFVIRQLGLLTIVLSGLLLLSALLTMVWVDKSVSELIGQRAMLVTVAIGAAVGGMLWVLSRHGRDLLGRREALLLVAVCWLGGAALAGLPYWFWAMFTGVAAVDHPFRSFVSCYFEAMSGLTTTGATVLSDVESLPQCLLLWRALTHWLGGLGIVMLFVAVLPTLGVGGKRLFEIEAPGPKTEGVRPRIRETARVLWLIYLVLTVAQVIVLRAMGMNLFDAVCHTFATLATGGFGNYNASAGHFNHWGIRITFIVFMVLAGINFRIYYQLLRRQFRSVGQNPELRFYLGLLVVGSAVVAASLVGRPMVAADGSDIEPSIGAAIGHGVFQVVSIQTTTGLVTADFDKWSTFPKTVLLVLMFVGASAGSTGGGIKVIRCLVVFKVMLSEIERVFRPNVVRTIRVGKWAVDPELRQSTIVYVLGILLLFMLGTILLLLLEGDHVSFTTAATACAATLNNIGPGMELVGATSHYGHFSAASKALLSLLMALGRLEVYAMLVLFVPSFWRGQ